MSSFSFIITEKCNWTCDYCYFPTIVQKEPRIDSFQKHFPYIKKVLDKLSDNHLLVHIDIQGGEVGTVPLEILQYIFQTIKRPIAVSTNGEFLKNEYHHDKLIRQYLGPILWHVTDDFKSNLTVDYNDDEIHISKGIVHNNVDEIVNFVRENDHIIFDYIEFEFDITEERYVDLWMYCDLIDKLQGFENITQNAWNVLTRRFSESLDHRDNCKNLNGTIVIDMVNENICLCQRHPNVSIELNEENLIKRLTSLPRDIWSEDTCKSCTRLYAGKFYGNVIERWLNIRRISWT